MLYENTSKSKSNRFPFYNYLLNHLNTILKKLIRKIKYVFQKKCDK